MNAPALPNRLDRFFLHFARQFLWGCLGLLVFPVLGRAIFASIAFATKRLTDTVLGLHGPVHEAGRALTAPFLLFAGLVAARFFCDAAMWFCSYNTRSPMLIRVKEEVFAYAQRLSPAYFESTLSGKIAHRAVMLPDQMLMLFDMTVFDFIPGAMFFVFVAAYFYVASPAFCAAASVGIVIYFSGSLLLGRECARRAAANNETRAAVTGRIVDVITNVRNVFCFANQTLEDRELTRYTGEERERRMALYRSVVRLRCSQYGMDILMWIGFVGGSLYGWVHGLMTAGDFVMVTALTGSLLQPAYNLGQRIPDFYDQLGSARESIEQLKLEEQQQERRGNFERVAQIRYGELRQLGQELAKLNAEMDAASAGESPRTVRMLKEEVDEEDVARIVSKWTGIPVSKMLEGEVRKLIEMEDRLHQRVIDQQEAISKVSNAVRRSRAGLSDPKRPIGSFIFLGPTGVGKTELARALAEFLFDDEHNMVRIDMSEYMEKHAVSRLIGAPPGYVGYEEGGQLTEAVRRRPYSVVLLDEIEKAHPDVFNVLLQIMDDGRLTDGKGRTVDFKNVVLIMTSNLGAAYLTAEALRTPEGYREASQQVMTTLQAHFKPEFLNRVDDIIIFNPLGKEQLARIVELRLEDLRRQLADRKISLELTEAAKELIFTEGHDPVYGARPLKRAIQRLIQDPLALKILDGEVRHGDHVIADADQREGKIVFRVSERVGEKQPAA